MATTLNFKDIIDLPQWRPEAPTLAASVAGASLSSDLRNDGTRHPFIYFLRSLTAFDAFDPTTSEWIPLASPALASSFVAGSTSVFHPSAGPRGLISTGATTTSIVLSTALPSAVGTNQLANRGDGEGFVIRIIGSGAGSSGKIEERRIIANTSGTTPTITLDVALSFTPVSGDSYEIIAGRVFLLGGGTNAAGIWKYYDIATNSFSGNLANTNLPAAVTTDSAMVSLSELHVSNDRKPGEGFVNGGATYNAASTFNCIQATAATANTITGSGMPSLFADEYRNFQIRVVEDTVNTTAVGQRRKISTHTSGSSSVFTTSTNWTVTPSSSAKFVVENDDDKILMRSSGGAAVYNYNITANTWDITTWATPVSNGNGSVGSQAFGITRDAVGNARHSFIYFIRGGASAAVDVLDIAGAATGIWSNDIVYGNKAQTFTTGTCGVYSPATFGGRFLNINVNGTQRMARLDLRNRVMDSQSYLRFPQGTAINGAKMAHALFIDGTTKLSFIYHLTDSQAQMFSLAVQR